MTTAIILVSLSALCFGAFALYGVAYHRGHVDGFHEGHAVAKDDIHRIIEDYHHWRDLSERPYHYPCLLLVRVANPKGRPLYHVRRFETLTEFTAFCTTGARHASAVMWYDIQRIS